MKDVLIIEDDKRIGPTVMQGLQEQGYSVSLVETGQAALELLQENEPRMIILDLGLPDCEGLDLLEQIRAGGCRIPVLILTARDTVADTVVGLNQGADDYLVKPFAFAELVARIDAILRRQSESSTTLTCGTIVIDLISRHVSLDGMTLDLTPREFDLLAFLIQHKGQTVSRDMIATYVWREVSRFSSLDNVIDVHVSRLRRKLTSPSGHCPLRVVRGVGLRIGDS